MKKFYSIVAGLLMTASVFAQAPEKMSYQAVVRNSSNALVTSTAVGMQISILQGSASGTPVYVETHTPFTNANGLVSLEIGTGTPVTGTFAAINWANGPYFIKTETDPTGGTAYTITGTSQLLSVPYALHAKTAETITGTITETDPVFGASVASGITGADTANWNNRFPDGSAAGNTPYWNGTSWVTNSSNIYNNGSNVGIGTSSPAPSAALEISSTTGALLLPRLTTAQRDLLTAEIGMIIFNTTDLKAQVCSADNTVPQIDQSNLVFDNSIYDSGQSFQAGMTGDWTQIEVNNISFGPQTGTLNIYSGEGNGGALLISQPISLVAGTNVITLSTPIPITAGNQYTFLTDILMNCSTSINPYANGTAYAGTNAESPYDLFFKIIVLPSTPVWTNLH